ncbi:MAG TPA: AAA domain-containing protein [Tepidisphaeraceae bacterium]|jgi:hypothetical protein|nr:AAA domain-containing protein [Tepidisphaeraceae bacterium]
MDGPNKILEKMLDRLLAGLVNGPSLNCRPYASRQRLDLVQLGKLSDVTPENALRALLGPTHETTIKARTPVPKNGDKPARAQKLKVAASIEAADENGPPLADGPIEEPEVAASISPERAFLEQQAVLNKLHTIAEDARTYEQDTGVGVLNVGFPLLSLPPGTFGGGKSGASKRVLAPLAFIPVAIIVKRGAAPAIELACKEEGVDRVMPNTALLAWLEQQTGQTVHETDVDDEGQHPWEEIRDIVKSVAGAMDWDMPELFATSAHDGAKSPDAGEHRASETAVKSETETSDASSASHRRAEDRAGTTGEASNGAAHEGGAFSGNGPSPQPSPLSTGEREPENTLSPEGGPRHGASAQGKTAADIIPSDFQLDPAPKADTADDKPRILCSAVLGLFPMANQGLLRDTQAMIGMGNLTGPVESFIRREVSLDLPAIVAGTRENVGIPQERDPRLPPAAINGDVKKDVADGSSVDVPMEASGKPISEASPSKSTPESRPVVIADERFISGSDPCQARAVRMVRECRGLVVHGPPGTGKSQTITNIIGDHLARGQRVLVVCDKRTALDVVFNRLNHLGLGNLCALVHDPRRDQRELYKSIRQQLDELQDATSDARVEAKLKKVDAELQSLHDELSQYRDSLVKRQGTLGEHGPNFSEMVGQWLSLAGSDDGAVSIEDVSLQTLDTYANATAEVLARGESIAYGTNPWVSAAGIALGDFLAQPMAKIRALARECEEASRSADQTVDPMIPPFAANLPLKQQADARTRLAAILPPLLESTAPKILTRWAKESADGLADVRRKIDAATAFAKTFEAGPLDGELLANLGDRPLDVLPIAEHLLKLAAYDDFAKRWYAFLPLKPKSTAAAVVNTYGLSFSAENANRVRTFLSALRARIKLTQLLREFISANSAAPMENDAVLGKSLKSHLAIIDLMTLVRTDPGFTGLSDRIADVLVDVSDRQAFFDGLAKSPARAAALEKLEATLSSSRLFDGPWLATQSAAFRAGQPALRIVSPLAAQIETLEGVVRIRQGLNMLPVKLRTAVEALMAASIEPHRAAEILRRSALAQEISGRLKSDPHLQEIDGHRLETAFTRYRELDENKRKLTRDVIRHFWISRQQDRLLAQTRSRLNTQGADLRRRLMLRGERALRLRQVVKVGAQIEGGDPLFDFCPIWLCSPETVAQVFPCEPVFDVLVFDEASQMRLEESLPVLMRGKRIVIAGDPRQLPPTRFFESAVAASDEEDAETDQDLFEQHQGEIEDLLTAALGLDIQQCYLDVHYRSRHADLIAFSNGYFYNSRLQPIPGHPANRRAEAAVVLDHVGGVYEMRRNEIEADRIVEIVRELLARKEPPSIGIACFNLVQRDLVAERLDELAAEEPAFAKRLDAARNREGEGSFEGLFIKNLENVQGDERDYILISTTYGPDANGKFYRRFGPLGRAGGGRRLNVLVTRAREKVHVVTSVPREAYHSLPQLDPGQTPGGAWLLLAYLKYAEDVGRPGKVDGEVAADAGDAVATAIPTGEAADANRGMGGPPMASALPEGHGRAARATAEEAPATQQTPAPVHIFPSKSPSLFAESLAQRLAVDHGLSSDVHWGNEGFCVDVALHNPDDPSDVTIGVLCDAARFAAADDPMQWDIFRTGILEEQGWKLHRVWTPHFFRDPGGVMEAVVAEARGGKANASRQAGVP